MSAVVGLLERLQKNEEDENARIALEREIELWCGRMSRKLGRLKGFAGPDAGRVGELAQEAVAQLYIEFIHSGSKPVDLKGVRRVIRSVVENGFQLRAAEDLSGEEVSYGRSPGEAAIHKELSSVIRKIMGERLDEEERAVVRGRFFDGKKQQQLAADLKMSNATVSRRLHSGLAKIEAELRRLGYPF